jgi:hypothetical protein
VTQREGVGWGTHGGRNRWIDRDRGEKRKERVKRERERERER